MRTGLNTLLRWALPAGITSLALAGMLEARAHAAGTSDPAISVTPNTGLSDGQRVQVAGSGFQNQQILIIQCGGGDPNARPVVGPVCGDQIVAAQADAQGNFPAQDFVVHASFSGTRYVKGRLAPASHTCAPAGDCYIYAYAKNKAQRHAREDLTFAAVP